jgi:hypothetical protein
VGLNASGESRVDVNELSRQLWERWNDRPGIVYADARNAVMRAARARELGHRLETNPDGGPNQLAKNYPENPGINRQFGDYQYRVVVRLVGNGQDFETLVTINARDRLDGSEIIARANRIVTDPNRILAEYRRKMQAVGDAPRSEAWIVSASRNTGTYPTN